MNIVIIGAGAMGSLLYQQLQINHQVSFLPKPGAIEQGLPKSLSFIGLDKQTQRLPLHYASKQQIADADLIICALKAYQFKDAIAHIAEYLPTRCPVILQHNGMGVYQQIRPLLDSQQPIGVMLSTQAARRLNSNQIQHTGHGQWQLGNYQNLHPDLASIKALLSQLQDCQWYDEIRTMQWTKLAINCVINPLTAIHDVLNGELAQDKYNSDVEVLIQEVIGQAELRQIPLQSKTLRDVVYQVMGNTAENSSSMREDIRGQRLSEIDYINGYIVKCAQQMGMSAPHNEQCVEQIKRLQPH